MTIEQREYMDKTDDSNHKKIISIGKALDRLANPLSSVATAVDPNEPSEALKERARLAAA
jgi:hypothetical protein